MDLQALHHRKQPQTDPKYELERGYNSFLIPFLPFSAICMYLHTKYVYLCVRKIERGRI
ncbi:hypothetical protein Hanom_Chr17g01563071 [Helianthus anomalus]